MNWFPTTFSARHILDAVSALEKSEGGERDSYCDSSSVSGRSSCCESSNSGTSFSLHSYRHNPVAITALMEANATGDDEDSVAVTRQDECAMEGEGLFVPNNTDEAIETSSYTFGVREHTIESREDFEKGLDSEHVPMSKDPEWEIDEHAVEGHSNREGPSDDMDVMMDPQSLLNKRMRSLSATVTSSPSLSQARQQKRFTSSSSTAANDIETVPSEQVEQPAELQSINHEQPQPSSSISAKITQSLHESRSLRESLYLKFTHTMAHFIHTHDLRGLMEMLYQPYLEPDMRLLTKYWNRSIHYHPSPSPSLSSSSTMPKSLAAHEAASIPRAHQTHSHPSSHHSHPYSGRNLLKNGRYHILKLFAFHFQLIPDGMFQIDDIRIIPTIHGSRSEGKKSGTSTSSSGEGDGVRIVSSFRYSGTLVSTLPLPSCEDMHNHDDIHTFLQKIQTSTSVTTSTSMTSDAAAQDLLLLHQSVLEPRYASHENRHLRHEILKNVLGHDIQGNADVMRRLGGIFDADHWLRSQTVIGTGSGSGNSKTGAQQSEKQLRFISREEMLVTLSMVRPTVSTPSPDVASVPLMAVNSAIVAAKDSHLAAVDSSATSILPSDGSLTNNQEKRKKSVNKDKVNKAQDNARGNNKETGSLPNVTNLVNTNSNVSSEETEHHPPLGLLEEFNALFEEQQQQAQQRALSSSTTTMSHAVQMFINVSGYFIIHFNTNDKVDRIEFHYYDV